MGRSKVSWFKRRQEDPIHIEIPESTLTRWALYDLGIVDPNEVSGLIGLTPVSAEGEKVEIGESEERLINILYYIPFVELISELASKIIVTSQIKNNPEIVNSDPAQLEADIATLTEIYRGISYSSIVLALSLGTHLNLIPEREE